MKKTVFIAGASAGIGKALAKEFNSRGFEVHAGARRLEKMSDLAELGIKTYSVDVTSQASVDELKRVLESELDGKLDILYSNAAVITSLPALDTSMEDAEAMISTNFLAAHRLVRAFAPWVIATKGIIAITGSVAADVTPPWSAVYNGSKAAVKAYARSLQFELDPLGVTVIDVITGVVSTDLGSEQVGETDYLPKDSYYNPAAYPSLNMHRSQEGFKASEPEEYAKSVVGDVLKRKPRVYGGATASVSWYLVNLIPFSIRSKIIASTFKLGEIKSYFLKKSLEDSKIDHSTE